MWSSLCTEAARFLQPGLLRPRRFDDDPVTMRRSDDRAALTDVVARFQAEVRELALATVQAVIKQELERKLAKQPARTRRASARTDASATRTRDAAPAATGEQLTLPIGTPTDAPAAAPAPTTAPATTATGTRKRVPWTREAIINELATWMLSGTAIDATFVRRYGPPGLVAAARRVFGRFDAALNVAGLHVSKLYPDGPPQRGPT
jgi:hypothetical protein